MAIGYACLMVGAEGTTIRSVLLRKAMTETIERVARENLAALKRILEWNAAHDIHMFRISSDIIPLATHPVNSFHWEEALSEPLQQIGQLIRDSGIRVSMHPGQYTVLNSPEERVRLAAVEELRYHAAFLDALGTDGTSKIVLHAGGVYGNRMEARDRFAREAAGLPDTIRRRLIVENDDTRFPLEDVLWISKETGLPVVFDNLHHHVEPSPSLIGATDAELITLCRSTWKKEDGKQKVHYSQHRPERAPGAHSETISLEPFLDWYRALGNNPPDVMLEVKDKNLSALKCVLALQPKLNPNRLESEWARYKYVVLEHDAAAYQSIRQLLKDKEAIWRHPGHVVPLFYRLVDDALALPEQPGAAVNALQHVWGYVSGDASDAERKRWKNLMEGYQNGTTSLKAIKGHLHRCVERQQHQYLLDSLYFYL